MYIYIKCTPYYFRNLGRLGLAVIKFEGLVNWKGIYSLIPSEMKGNINNCPLIDKYKLSKPFHQKKCKKQILFFSACCESIHVCDGGA